MPCLGSSNRSPPPPTPFSGRHMLPPTSPQYSKSQYGALPPPPHPPSSRVAIPPHILARDSTTQQSGHRPGSSMSISSMLGVDAESNPRDPIRPHSNGPSRGIPPAAQSPTKSNVQDTSSHGTPQRSNTPDTYKSWNSEHTRQPRAYSGGPPSRSFSSLQPGSPEFPRFAAPPQTHQGQSAPYYQITRDGQFQPSESDASRRRTSVGSLATPNSNRPLMVNHSCNESERVREDNHASAASDPVTGSEKLFLHQGSTERSESRYAVRQNTPERAHTYTPRSVKPAQSQPPQYGVRDGQSNVSSNSNYPFLARQPPQSSPFDRRFPGLADKIPQDHTSGTNLPTNLNNGQTMMEAYQDMRPVATVESRPLQQDVGSSLSQGVDGIERQRTRDSPLGFTSRNSRATPSSDVIIHSVEEGSHGSKLLGFLAENKRGRVSPLPQAVQGAQARMKGPTSEPGIKKEFGMMFSGIGSGVGSNMSTPVPPDIQTPDSVPSSPTRFEEAGRRTPLGTKANLSDVKKARRNPAKRSRKTRDNDIKREEIDARVAPNLLRSLSGMSGASGRAPKRSRQSYQPTSTPINQA